ncbi:hypothetical protein [Allobaculum sp. JKK-2023]|uniref:hypothetical protein n=1 Tax=Allobaculum sp. JKK-2023 TaxID=3108943 RepID=UPI002B05BAC1|nr:hypothetical protein [Allobaculum sp. JKK-2023]
MDHTDKSCLDETDVTKPSNHNQEKEQSDFYNPLLIDLVMRNLFCSEKNLIEPVLCTLLDKSKLMILDDFHRSALDIYRPPYAIFDILEFVKPVKRAFVYLRRAKEYPNPLDDRYQCAKFDMEFKDLGNKVHDLPEIYHVVIMDHDFFGEGEPVYEAQWSFKKTGKLLGDGSHILYINGDNRSDTPLGRLIHDLFCPVPEDMYDKKLGEWTGELIKRRTAFVEAVFSDNEQKAEKKKQEDQEDMEYAKVSAKQPS